MITLTISTSSAKGSLCLGNSLAVLGHEHWHKKTSHSEVITQTLENLLKKTNTQLKDIQLLICSTGPGSFTGLRVGLSVTRSLAYSLKIPIIAMNDGFAIALQEPALNPTHILTVIDAQKNKVFAGLYQKHLDHMEELQPPTLLAPFELEPLLKESQYVAMGDGLEILNEFSPLKNKIKTTEFSPSFPDAKVIHTHVFQNFKNFSPIHWKELLPLYLRASAAEEVRAEKLSKQS